MAQLRYDMLRFLEQKDDVRVIFSKRFYLDIGKSELESIAPLKVINGTLEFDCSQQRAERRFLAVLESKLQALRSLVTDNRAVYIHRNSGIPLVGNVAFGIVYRNSSIIEIKPQTTCNLDCVYCSVNEGLSSKQTDYLVERSYILEEFKRYAEYAGVPVEAHIGIQGEPLIYEEFAALAQELSPIDNVHRITTDTNGTVLTKPLIDKLSKIQKLRLNISLNATDKDVASKMAGAPYNTAHVMEMARYAAEKMDILIAPLYVPGYNDNELIKVVEFSKTLPQKDYPLVCIQNFLNYETGRNPVKQAGWEQFTGMLHSIEKKTGVHLIVTKEDFKITEAKKLPKPFVKGKSTFARIVAPGRYPNTRLAAAKERNITVFGCSAPIGKEIKVRILRSKHNVFFAKGV
ncbi:radical SAM protein [Candidatus Woesearchaeota archaeon]|nr:radical SAM protein [Candidatus Woesearchaeota archaeon]